MVAIIRFVFTILLLGIVALSGLTYWANSELTTPIAHSTQPIVVARGERLDQILAELKEHGVIRTVLPLKLYLKLKRQELLVQAGSYVFPSPSTPLQVVTRLQQGGEFDKLTIIEGWTRWDIADAMLRVPSLGLKSREQALALLSDTSLVKDLDPRATNLEGYLFPDTYFVVANSTPRELVAKAVERYREVWNTKLKARAASIKMTPHEATTMASIIETEAKLKQERPIIASVIYKRLARKMPLSMDSTIVYASKLAGAWRNNGIVYKSDVERKSPYNTRLNAGLPPGPVGSPGYLSLEAAVAPASTNYLFYVRDPDRNDGAHTFYSDAKSFETGVAKLRAWEARQKR